MKSTGVATPRPRYSRDEFSRRGLEFYERIRPQVEEGNRGKIVAIDIESGAYEVAAATLNASRRLRSRHPDAQTWCVQIGYQEFYRFSRSSTRISCTTGGSSRPGKRASGSVRESVVRAFS